MNAVELIDVTAEYPGRIVLDSISFAVAPGEMTALLGPNGAGKSTLLKVITGWLRCRKGAVRLFGSQPSVAERVKLLGVVPQDFTVSMPFRVEEILAMSRSAELDDAGYRRILEQTDIAGLTKRIFGELSGGERQRAALAFALVSKPKVLLLDEPSSHLDLKYRLELMRVLQRINREEGVAVVMVCHDLQLAGRFFGRLVLLKDGRIFKDGSAAEVLVRPVLEEAFGCSLEEFE